MLFRTLTSAAATPSSAACGAAASPLAPIVTSSSVSDPWSAKMAEPAMEPRLPLTVERATVAVALL